ncbi:MAG: signal transduction histidine kinase [Marivirga sp.]
MAWPSRASIKDDDTVDLIAMIEKGSEQLKSKLNNYIDNLSNNQQIKIVLEEVNFQESLTNVSVNINTLITSSKTNINSDFSAAETILFNGEYINSVFLNLLSNSIKYAKPGIPPGITIWTEKYKDKVKLYFQDNGVGIDLETAKGKIFGPHQTFHNSNNSNNSNNSKGIGLQLVHTYVTSFGGKIEVESAVGKGSIFILTFYKNLN